MKKFYLACAAAALCGVCLNGTAQASPLKNYDAGNIAIDAGITLPSSFEGYGYKMDKSNSGYLGGTVGLGSNTALNYKWNKYTGDDGKINTHQLNLMYKFMPGLSAYVGYIKADADTEIGGNDKDSIQGGLQASYDIPALFTVWGNIGLGGNSTTYEIGISKPILNNLEVNLSYYDNKFRDAIGRDGDIDASGVNMGLTLKF